MTFNCGDCRVCGKCYPKKRACPDCDGPIILDEMDECPSCGFVITAQLREDARRAFMKQKREQYAKLFPKAAMARPMRF